MLTGLKKYNWCFIIFSLLYIGCGKQYYYLNKVRASPKKGSFDIFIENKSPKIITSAFEAEIKDAAIRKLIKAGHEYKPKQPTYHFTLVIYVDSVRSSGTSYIGGSNMGRAIDLGISKNYTLISKGIYLKLQASKVKTAKDFWEMDYDLYYFAQPKRDKRRTRGVVRYMVSTFKE
jgi:hypothetical protein